MPVDRTHLPDHDVVPSTRSLGAGNAYLSCERAGGSVYESPVQLARQELDAGLPVDELLTTLWETLELPAEPRHYHFALQAAFFA